MGFNIIDVVIILILGIYVLSGVYKGFLWSVSAFGATLIACCVALIFMGPVTKAFASNETLFDSMLSYTEGSEAVYDVEYAKMNITELSNNEINEVMSRADLPYPMGERIYENIMSEAFSDKGVEKLGDYFNQSMVMVMLNIASFLIIYMVVRLVITLLLCWFDYAVKLPKMKKLDWLVGGGIGIVRAIAAVSLIFMMIPIVLTILPFDQIKELMESSMIASFFYHSNLLLRLIPGV